VTTHAMTCRCFVQTIEADIDSHSKVWLMRVPIELATQWEKAEEAWGEYHAKRIAAEKKSKDQRAQEQAQEALAAAERAS
jgi:hypothetical protein